MKSLAEQSGVDVSDAVKALEEKLQKLIRKPKQLKSRAIAQVVVQVKKNLTVQARKSQKSKVRYIQIVSFRKAVLPCRAAFFLLVLSLYLQPESLRH